MKLVLAFIVLFAAVVTVSAQANDGVYSAWSDCTRICEGGTETKTCQPKAAGSTSNLDCVIGTSVIQPCNTAPCPNCTVTPYWTGYSSCDKTCGGGVTWQSRSIVKEQGIGGTPCPQLNFTYACNTQMCSKTIYGMGYYFFGPLKGPGPISYTVQRINEDIDVFLFDEANFVQYQYDAARTTPYQTNYVAIKSSLDIDTVKAEGPITLDVNTNYYLVIDHTLIGAAKGTATNNGQVFNPNQFAYSITGLETGDGYNTAPTSGASAAAGASIGLIAALATVVAAFTL